MQIQALKKTTHGNEVYLHKIILTICWCIFANFSIFFSMYRNRAYYFYAHVVLSSIIVASTICMVLLLLILHGFQFGEGHKTIQNIHNVVGLSILITIFFQFSLGILTRWLQKNTSIKFPQMMKIKNVHRYFGYLLILFCKFQVLSGWYKRYKYKDQSTIFFLVILWEIISLCLFVKTKFQTVPTLQQSITYKSAQSISQIRKISDISEVQHSGNIIIFANYIYDAKPLYQNHPGGYEAIKAISGREVDRFLYGMYSPEKKPYIGVHSHSQDSLSILGDPIAKLCIQPTFLGMNSINSCKIIYKLNYHNKFYVLGLQSDHNDEYLKYVGYHQYNQLGQYYAVNVGKITRLYTVVNCIRYENINSIKKLQIVTKQEKIKLNKLLSFSKQDLTTDNSDNMLTSAKHIINNESKSIVNQIPIMFKRYPQGKLTSLLSGLQENDIVNISEQRGIGMRLDSIKSGLLVFVAGGTGLYPFMDLIDILFKTAVNQNERNQQFILQNPILQSGNLFQKFNFRFLIAVNHITDIHPLTLYQLKYLTNQSKTSFTCYLRINQYENQLQQQYHNFHFVHSRFNEILQPFLNQTELSKVFICGPPKMNTNMVQLMEQQSVQQENYMIM